MRLAHGWKLAASGEVTESLVREFVRPAVRAAPAALARRLGRCFIRLLVEPESTIASRWTAKPGGFEIELMTAGQEDHDVAMELLLCLGQCLWERLSDHELRSYWTLLSRELEAGIEGEIDEQAYEAKRRLQRSKACARNLGRLLEYGRASFSATAAEYVHSLWHDVTVREGSNHLPAAALRRRLELLRRWFPPNRGYRLFPAPGRRPASAVAEVHQPAQPEHRQQEPAEGAKAVNEPLAVSLLGHHTQHDRNQQGQ
jgi:hypothetical protein